MSSPLDAEAVDRLCKLLGMLGSAHDGERAAAGLKAHELIRRHGLQWADVVRQPISTTRDHDRDRKFDARNDCGEQWRSHYDEYWQAQRMFCLHRTAYLNEKECVFLHGLHRWQGPLTERQQAWLDSIHAKLRRREAA